MKKWFKSGLITLFGLLIVFMVFSQTQATLLSLPNLIFFTSYRTGNAEVYSMKPDGSSLPS